MTPGSVAIIILNWKRPREVVDCLRSISELDYANCWTIVVDNGSNNDSVASIRREFPEVVLVENGRNLGFAAGCNVGVRLALESGAEYVLLLNDDTVVAPDMLRAMVDVAVQDASIGMVGPKIYYYNQPNLIWSAGGRIGPKGDPEHLRIGELDDGSLDQPRDVDYLTGCCLLIKRDVVERVGGLDERFFAYYEETEWCARTRRAGFRLVYAPEARVWHKIEQADRGGSNVYQYLMARNRLLYVTCGGGGRRRAFATALDMLRIAASWLLRPNQAGRRTSALALLRGMLDFGLGRFGAPPVHL